MCTIQTDERQRKIFTCKNIDKNVQYVYKSLHNVGKYIKNVFLKSRQKTLHKGLVQNVIKMCRVQTKVDRMQTKGECTLAQRCAKCGQICMLQNKKIKSTVYMYCTGDTNNIQYLK